MKNSLLFLFFFIFTATYSQKIMTVKNAIVFFEASVPIFEPVAAKNESIGGVLNVKRGYISFEIPMKNFRFERSLMETHFNENYLETNRFPKATFKGIIEKFEIKIVTSIPKIFVIKGKITIHGQSKNITVTGKIKQSEKGIELLSEFSLNTDDFAIDIPYLVRDKISKNVSVSISSIFQ
ncbi:YceI family protein [Flavobacterium sp. NG2]|uniref:YceI family protein n=1 Tax=Flavobacterium sp. NG2 TaxID=3097547 RepID=UPI002A82FE7C|nr:YceI family protein [Flavobacterium sp. NG2]WPR71044.1 YceI family protein [Flavobacterium sp. NG2]